MTFSVYESMGKSIKILLILVVLILPAMIFIFLWNFGQNRFDVPVQHPEGLKIAECEEKTGPLEIPAVDSLGLTGDDFKVIYMNINDINKKQLNELRRLSDNNPEVRFVFFMTDSTGIDKAREYSQNNWHIYNVKKASLAELNRCGFGNIDDHALVLADPERHVRGYYDLKEKQELDRLEGEIKILTQ